jgi:hypothetical protein
MITFLVLVSVFAPTARSQARYRNLKDYTQGPSLHLKDQYLDAKNTELQIAPARQFLWELWKAAPEAISKKRPTL